MSSFSRFNFPTPIYFGAGVRRELGAHLKSKKMRRPLLVTDRAYALLPDFRELQESLSKDGLELAVFSEIWGNPVVSQVMAGVDAYRKHGADSVVGMGGGAALDVSKAILLMLHHPGKLFDYEDEIPNARPIDQEIPPWVALPTTAGTGSEVGRSAVISDETSHVKKIIFSPRLLASAVFADPELTVGLPPKITANTGMDALTHLIEAYLAKAYHPLCDGIALEGLHLAASGLQRAVKDPKNLEARGSMLMASMMGAIAFQKGLGLVHSCAHALSAAKDLHHGLANGVMIDWALRFNAEAVPDRFARLCEAAFESHGKADEFLAWLQRLKSAIGIPARLGELGVGPSDLDLLAKLAFQDSCHQSNPVPVTQAQFRAIFAEAL